MSNYPKFRVWDKRNKVFLASYKNRGLQFSTIYRTDGKPISPEEVEEMSEENFHFDNGLSLERAVLDTERFIVQQYTGLNDKTKKEIYDGDIIIFMGCWDEKGNVLTPDYRKYQVCWFMGGFRAIIRTLNAYHRHNECVGVGHTDSEIIGNIIENPELMAFKK